ncbi:hypothetical protein PLESTB_000533500 [Pleodorina starrii]|uniref:PPPDE domain-containing protein n=1 Tax=Pleodorina starrii TaxID=330485 RepID=A0A9W6BH70_9CHLO|nr:hypothetical protein PLESTM_000397700 [Pleodorina starrii]GLC51728.1 hypothetical protein PLESTB_000533500 [Pleodorina starrii]
MAPVVLNIYDLAPQNNWTYWCGVGIFHSGVEVHGVEYAYGGHDYDYSGIFATNPRDAPGQVIFRESIPMGETDMSQQDIHRLVQRMGNDYKGNSYHLLQRNCNHFASDFCQQLVGKEAPSWINRLAGIAVMFHCLFPPSWVPPLQTPSAVPTLGNAAGGSSGRDEGKLLLAPGGQRSDVYGERLQPSAVLPSASGTRI